jgi:hypothetical protein
MNAARSRIAVKPWFFLSILNIDLVPSASNRLDWERLFGLTNVAEDLGLCPKAGRTCHPTLT